MLRCSTRIKYEKGNWTFLFKEHYDKFYKALKLGCQSINTYENEDFSLPPINIWKTNGDEMLFFISIIDSFNNKGRIKFIQHRFEMALFYIIAFKQTIQEYNKNEAFKVKGTAWIGNTPIFNYQVLNEDRAVDFIGKSIDIGFRLSKYATIGKMVISVDLAIIMMRDNYLTMRRNDLILHFDNREILKGVLNDMPYPIIWINMHHPLTEIEADLSGKKHQDSLTIMQYLVDFIEATNGQIHYPYIPGTPENEPFSDKWENYDFELNNLKKIKF